ncbi:hypothetical protein C7M84_001156 [Penaeus vannamei]|uniref:Uncharacterized protein n=1 Tax=Penaeus vannamei TaxID=6689 RepID=A0A3R7ME09_PENVA|nr:hypothetical protein C7M84_001156 [Penaeus vannamei]
MGIASSPLRLPVALHRHLTPSSDIFPLLPSNSLPLFPYVGNPSPSPIFPPLAGVGRTGEYLWRTPPPSVFDSLPSLLPSLRFVSPKPPSPLLPPPYTPTPSFSLPFDSSQPPSPFPSVHHPPPIITPFSFPSVPFGSSPPPLLPSLRFITPNPPSPFPSQIKTPNGLARCVTTLDVRSPLKTEAGKLCADQPMAAQFGIVVQPRRGFRHFPGNDLQNRRHFIVLALPLSLSCLELRLFLLSLMLPILNALSPLPPFLYPCGAKKERCRVGPPGMLPGSGRVQGGHVSMNINDASHKMLIITWGRVIHPWNSTLPTLKACPLFCTFFLVLPHFPFFLVFHPFSQLPLSKPQSSPTSHAHSVLFLFLSPFSLPFFLLSFPSSFFIPLPSLFPPPFSLSSSLPFLSLLLSSSPSPSSLPSPIPPTSLPFSLLSPSPLFSPLLPFP